MSNKHKLDLNYSSVMHLNIVNIRNNVLQTSKDGLSMLRYCKVGNTIYTNIEFLTK